MTVTVERSALAPINLSVTRSKGLVIALTNTPSGSEQAAGSLRLTKPRTEKVDGRRGTTREKRLNPPSDRSSLRVCGLPLSGAHPHVWLQEGHDST